MPFAVSSLDAGAAVAVGFALAVTVATGAPASATSSPPVLAGLSGPQAPSARKNTIQVPVRIFILLTPPRAAAYPEPRKVAPSLRPSIRSAH